MRLFLLLISFVALSCSPQPLPAPGPGTTSPPPKLPTAPGSYLALGDSYTIGEGVSSAERWPVQLAELVRKQHPTLLDPEIIARTGWTTAELAEAIKSTQLSKTYDLVSLQIGVNNQYRGQTVARYRTEFQELLRTAVKLAGNRASRVVVLSIPDWGQSPFAAGRDRARIGFEIDQFNAVASQECSSLGISFVDITPLTRAAANDDTQFTSDGLHYSGPQMGQWAQQSLPVVEAALLRP